MNPFNLLIPFFYPSQVLHVFLLITIRLKAVDTLILQKSLIISVLGKHFV
jgi:hypothetical protein